MQNMVSPCRLFLAPSLISVAHQIDLFSLDRMIFANRQKFCAAILTSQLHSLPVRIFRSGIGATYFSVLLIEALVLCHVFHEFVVHLSHFITEGNFVRRLRSAFIISLKLL